MNTINPERQISSTASFASSSINPSPSDYTSNQSSYTPRPCSAEELSPLTFPFPTLLDDMDPEKRPTPVRRASKLNLLSKLFSSSKRHVKESKKSVRDFGKDKGNATSTTASPTTFHLSRDAAQVFGTLRQSHKNKSSITKQKANRNGLVRQTSETSMIGSVLEIPSSSTSSSTLEETAEEVPPAMVMEATCTGATRPKFMQRATSFRTSSSCRPTANEFSRTASTRSVSFQPEQQATTTPSPTPIQATSPSSPTSVNSNNNYNRVEISPGNFQSLRGHQETLQYVRRDEVGSTTCLFCHDTIYSINDAAMVVCPTCRSISPTTTTENGEGLALGFSAHEWLDIQREALNMPPP